MLLLAAVAAALGAVGDFRASLDRFLFLAAATSGYALLLWRYRAELGGVARLSLPVAPLVLSPLACTGDLGAVAYLAALLYLLLFAARSRRLGPALGPWVISLAAAAFLAHMTRTVPAAWMATDAVFRWISGAVNRLCLGVSFTIGPTGYGSEFLLFYWALLVARSIPAERRVRGWAAIAAGVVLPLVVVPLLYLWGARWNAAMPAGTEVYEPLFAHGGSRRLLLSLASWIWPRNLGLGLVPLVIGLDALLVAPWLAPREAADRRSPGPRAALGALLFLTASGLLAAPLLSRNVAAPAAPHVLVGDPGGVLLAPPEDDRFGFVQSGMFAKLPVYLRLLGYQVDRVDPAVDSLAGADILVLINLPDALPPERVAAIHAFVAAGGSLLCLGDHVAGDQIAGPFNDLLAPCGIRFNRDSARAPSGWTPGLLELHRFVYADPEPGGDVADRAAIGTGASLEVGGSAVPVFVGRRGFQDASDPDNTAGGELGDLVYRYGEESGDLVLAAEDRLGEGRILVFGDTSSFQNSALCLSHELVARVFRFLAARQAAAPGGHWLLLPALVLIALLLFRKSGSFAGVVVVLLVFGHATLDRAARREYRPGLEFAPHATGQVALIDFQHNPDYAPWSGTGAGIGGIDANLLRRGIVALTLYGGYEALDHAGFLFLLAPNRKITPAEAERLRAFMRGGGHVIVSADPFHGAALEHLFRWDKISVQNQPLGEFQAESVFGTRVEFVSGWPIDAVIRPEALVSAWDRDIIGRFACGAGSLVVIGDARFLREDNLETATEYHDENVRFFRALVEELTGSAKPEERR